MRPWGVNRTDIGRAGTRTEHAAAAARQEHGADGHDWLALGAGRQNLDSVDDDDGLARGAVHMAAVGLQEIAANVCAKAGTRG